MQNSRLQYLLSLCLQNTASEAERKEFISLVGAPENKELASGLILQAFNTGGETERLLDQQQSEEILQSIILAHDIGNVNDFDSQPAHRVHFLRRSFFRYAAAIILLLGVGAIAIVVFSDRRSSSSETISQTLKQADVPPGGEKAILTLGDGREIILDSAANGQLAAQGNALIVKLANGQIAYDLSKSAAASSTVMWNTMSTPKGGQYRVTLPDGTKVWLNAASSITFPTAFSSDKRQVKVTGEVYFEVAKNKQKPFVVDVDSKMNVQVLGTSFNVNSYADEENIKATLVEGSVRVVAADKQVILKPGQQAMVAVAPVMNDSFDSGKGVHAFAPRKSNQQLEIVDANIDQTLAWKNGIFNFHNADLKTVMKQLERWYDIKVEYSNPNTNFTFKGEMYRNLNLSDVLEMLSGNGIRFQMKGKTLIVL